MSIEQITTTVLDASNELLGIAPVLTLSIIFHIVELADIAGSDELARQKIQEFCDDFVPQLRDVIVPDHQAALTNAQNKLSLYEQFKSEGV